MRRQSREQYTEATTQGWNRAFQNDWSEGKPPVEFLDTILANLSHDDVQGEGLYVGCGDGRNFLPLIEKRPDLHLKGIDISDVGITKLREKAPEQTPNTSVEDFTRAGYINAFNYIVAIQSFQHGDRETTALFFKKSRLALKPQGKLFLRVNSVSTDLVEDHDFVEGSRDSGIIVRYKGGEKAGQYIHYYSKQELGRIAASNSFKILAGPIERSHIREEGRGRWVQWETVWQKA